MRVRWANLSALMVVGALVLTMSSGCGLKRTGSLVDPGDEPEPTPAPVATPTPAPTKPDVPAGGGGQVTPVTPVVPLTARVQNIQITGLMFSRRVIAVVEVSNPSDRTLSGTITCTFGDGDDPEKVQTKDVTMMGRETKTFTFEEKSWWDKDAKVEIKTNQPVVAQTGFQNNYFGY